MNISARDMPLVRTQSAVPLSTGTVERFIACLNRRRLCARRVLPDLSASRSRPLRGS
jgi:hypothetical protein